MTTKHTLHGRRATAAIILAGTLVLAGCAGSDDDASGDSAASEAPASDASGADATDDRSTATDDAVDGDSGFDIGVIGRDVIIEMRVVLSSDNIQRTVAAIMADASALGGGVASSDVDYGSQTGNGRQDGYAVLVVKVPPQSIDRMLAGLDDTGTVQSINQSAQDVTEQLIDLDVRISNARQSVANVREFMDRTENLSELVTLEGELTRRQTELERLEAQQRNLGDRVALSTITIEVVPTAAVPTPEGDEGIGDAFAKGWDAFVAFFFGLAFVLAVVLPFLALAAVLLGAAWFILARVERRTESHDHDDHRNPDGDPDDDHHDDEDDPELTELVSASHED